MDKERLINFRLLVERQMKNMCLSTFEEWVDHQCSNPYLPPQIKAEEARYRDYCFADWEACKSLTEEELHEGRKARLLKNVKFDMEHNGVKSFDEYCSKQREILNWYKWTDEEKEQFMQDMISLWNECSSEDRSFCPAHTSEA